MKTTKNNDIKSFLKRAQNDAQLRDQLQQIKSTGPTRLTEIVRIATAAGYNFTEQEYEETARTYLAKKGPIGRQFTDEQIAAVAGCMN